MKNIFNSTLHISFRNAWETPIKLMGVYDIIPTHSKELLLYDISGHHIGHNIHYYTSKVVADRLNINLSLFR